MDNKSVKILLVDDEQAITDIFSEALSTAGFEVITASNGAQALSKVKIEKPSIIFLDQILPDMNGNEILEILKKDPETKDIPVAIVSNFTQDNMIQDAINKGAVDYLMKYQISPEDLVNKVNTILSEHKASRDTPAIPVE